MTESSGDTDLWLSSQDKVVVGERILDVDKENGRNGIHGHPDSSLCFPDEFPYEFDYFSESSARASPVDSVQDSTETEHSDDEEDYLAGLTSWLSQSSIHPGPIYSCEKTQKNWGLYHSPQSTLTRTESWSARSTVFGDGSPNGPSKIASPASTTFTQKNDIWDVIYAAAGQVTRLMDSEVVPPNYVCPTRRLFFTPQAATPVCTTKGSNNVMSQAQTFAQTNQQLNQIGKQVRNEQILKQQCSTVWPTQDEVSWLLKQQKQQMHSRVHGNGYPSGHRVRTRCLPQTAWHPLPARRSTQPSLYCRSATIGVPLGGSGVKRECAGTGVFLPRRYDGANLQPRKQTSCSAVSLPDKLVQTRNLDIEAAKQTRFACCFGTEHDAIVMARRNAVLYQHSRPSIQDEAANQEIRLPLEWTY